ncbi:hypothetical protein CC2G_008195 [Coprinopsis cinerea AmutBmut pab1-1]|nr:hypothetical protein CC2G_008195 [Coprinopsis cinerea AmutBmut pab1-1]
MSRPFQIESDASKYASGAVLTQMDSNGNRHPVAFLSKSFSPLNGITRSTTENSLELFEHLTSGATTSKEAPTKLWSIPITSTSRTSDLHKSSNPDKHVGN